MKPDLSPRAWPAATPELSEGGDGQALALSDSPEAPGTIPSTVQSAAQCRVRMTRP